MHFESILAFCCSKYWKKITPFDAIDEISAIVFETVGERIVAVH